MKVLYKVVDLITGILGGLLAGLIFKRLWKAMAGQRDVPAVTDEERMWREVLVAATLRGAVVALVKAVMGRGGAAGVRRLTSGRPASSAP